MKEIKFRARFRDKNGYEFWFPLTFTNHMHGEKSFLEISAEWEQLTDWEQYTGLTDANGVEIYEGDFIEFDEWAWGGSGNIFYVSWNEKLACWDYGGGASSDMCYRKVIGNIHENPELL